MPSIDHFVFCSGGNDSIALIQWIIEDACIDNVAVVYNDTGWAHPDWEERISWIEGLCVAEGFHFYRTESKGMEKLCREKQTFPMFGRQFCTQQLKIQPSVELMDELDPEREACVMVGVRREESRARSQFPEWTEDSVVHGGRLLWAPLVRHTEDRRNALVYNAGFEVLPYRSRECFPCIFANKQTVSELDEQSIQKVRILENELGAAWFRPKDKMGAKNIDEAYAWSKRNNRKKDITQEGCSSGYCGD